MTNESAESTRQMRQSTCVKCKQECSVIFDNGHCIECAAGALAKILGDLENP